MTHHTTTFTNPITGEKTFAIINTPKPGEIKAGIASDLAKLRARIARMEATKKASK